MTELIKSSQIKSLQSLSNLFKSMYIKYNRYESYQSPLDLVKLKQKLTNFLGLTNGGSLANDWRIARSISCCLLSINSFLEVIKLTSQSYIRELLLLFYSFRTVLAITGVMAVMFMTPIYRISLISF